MELIISHVGRLTFLFHAVYTEVNHEKAFSHIHYRS